MEHVDFEQRQLLLVFHATPKELNSVPHSEYRFLSSHLRKLKLYEEQELTMQVFSEPELAAHGNDGGGGGTLLSSTAAAAAAAIMGRRNSYEASQMGDNTYATIQPRHQQQPHHLSVGGGGGGAEVADYATLRNGSRAPSVS